MKIVYSKLKDMYLLAPSEDLFPCNVNKCLQWSCFEWVPCHLVFLWKENLCNYCEVLRGGARVMIEQGCTTCGSLAARKWRENEKMKRTWRENEEMEKYSLSIFLSDPSPIIGYACHWLTDWLTDSLTNCRLANLIDVPSGVKMPTLNLLRLLLLLMLMMRIVLATVCCRFGLWRLVLKLHFCSRVEVEVQARLWSWSLFSILPLMFCRDSEYKM